MLSENEARSIAERAVDRPGGIDALCALIREAHAPYPVQEMIVDQFRVFVRLRNQSGPAPVNVGPYTFNLRNRQLVLANILLDD